MNNERVRRQQIIDVFSISDLAFLGNFNATDMEVIYYGITNSVMV